MWEEVILVLVAPEAVPREKHHGDIAAGRLPLQPVQPLNDLLAGRFVVWEQPDGDLLIKPPLLGRDCRGKILGVLGGPFQVRCGKFIATHTHGEHVQSGFGPVRSARPSGHKGGGFTCPVLVPDNDVNGGGFWWDQHGDLSYDAICLCGALRGVPDVLLFLRWAAVHADLSRGNRADVGFCFVEEGELVRSRRGAGGRRQNGDPWREDSAYMARAGSASQRARSARRSASPLSSVVSTRAMTSGR